MAVIALILGGIGLMIGLQVKNEISALKQEIERLKAQLSTKN